MLNKLINKKNKDGESGFTIIEVLIVLAIAGLILVVVLIAIPQLQRNQRNSARQNDAARVGTSASNWVANNNGQQLDDGSEQDILDDLGTVGQYELTADDTFEIISSSSGSTEQVDNLNDITIVTNAVCDGGVATQTNAAPRQFVVLYATEDSTGSPNPSCLEV